MAASVDFQMAHLHAHDPVWAVDLARIVQKSKYEIKYIMTVNLI